MELAQQQQFAAGNYVTNKTVVSSSADVEQRPKHRLIRGSKKAVTITKRQYLKSDWCKTEPFQQIIQMVRSLLLMTFLLTTME